MADVISMADINATAMRFGIDFSTSDLDSITPRDEDFVLESDDEEDIFGEDDVPTLQTDFGNAIVVDNLPVVRPEKFEKLDVYVRNIYSKIGVMIKEDELWMPINPETEETLGYCFIEFHTRQFRKLSLLGS